jgi:hypothetical protein
MHACWCCTLPAQAPRPDGGIVVPFALRWESCNALLLKTLVDRKSSDNFKVTLLRRILFSVTSVCTSEGVRSSLDSLAYTLGGAWCMKTASFGRAVAVLSLQVTRGEELATIVEAAHAIKPADMARCAAVCM